MSDQFAETLGGFCWNFSITESNIRQTLYRISGVHPQIGNAIFSGTRVEGGMQLITRVAEVRKWPQAKREELKYVFDQLSIINKLRNDVLHFGAYRLGSDYIVSNRPVAHMPDRIREFRVSHETLQAAGADLAAIGQRLLFLVEEGHQPQIIEYLKKSSGARRPSWQYKSPPPAWPKSKSRNTRPKRPRRPQSSR
jgi:hypothetical protein